MSKPIQYCKVKNKINDYLKKKEEIFCRNIDVFQFRNGH